MELKLFNPPGTKDFFDKDVLVRNKIFDIARKKFLLYGGNELDTPVFEYYKNIEHLYGGEFKDSVYIIKNEEEDKKSEEKSDEKLFLRYDLTVPFCRFVAGHGIKFFKRFQIAKVYRKDTPQISKGRFREFYQCDFDICGDDQNSNQYDIEILCLLEDVLKDILDGGDKFTININHKDILINILSKCNIDNDKISLCILELDKLDKKEFEEIKQGLLESGVGKESLFLLEKYYMEFKDKTYLNVLELLEKEFGTESDEVSDEVSNGMRDMTNIINYLSATKKTNIVFNPFLARGLQYYTGLIFEVSYYDKTVMQSTIASGGRYNNMIGKFLQYKEEKHIPSIGLSLGIERLATILLNDPKYKDVSEQMFDVYVCGIGVTGNYINRINLKKMEIVEKLREKKLRVAYSHLNNPKMRPQLDFCLKTSIKWMIIIGENEIKNNIVTIKNLFEKTQATCRELDMFGIIN